MNDVKQLIRFCCQQFRKLPLQLLEECHDHILLTLGKRGCVYYGADGSVVRGRAITVEAVDTTAAGDTHFGFFLRGILDGRSVEEALKLAAVASGIAVTRPGAADSVPGYDEVVSSEYYRNF